jgi:hypothetical protein
LPGGATITYQLPNERDLLYVKAVYQLPDGSMQEVKSSVFSNSLTIKGYAKSKSATIKLVSVDRSQNESQPLEVDIHPEDSPIYAVLDALNIAEDWGGLTLQLQNPLGEKIMLSVNRQDENGVFVNLTNEYYYLGQKAAEIAIRGLEDVPTKFSFYVRDAYNNSTDTLILTKTPWYEVRLDETKFLALPPSNKFTYANNPNPMSVLWNDLFPVQADETGNPAFQNAQMYSVSGTVSGFEPYFGVDLGVKAKLTHFRYWSRENYFYRLRHPRYVQLWGTNDEAIAKNPESDVSQWTMLTAPPYYESIRPSGKGPATAALYAGDEDFDYAAQGEEILFPMDVPAMRYIRFKTLLNWSGGKELQLCEIRFWGDPR